MPPPPARVHRAATTEQLKEAGIIPDIIDALGEPVPGLELRVHHGSVAVQAGNAIPPSAAVEAPTVELRGGSPDAFYTLVS